MNAQQQLEQLITPEEARDLLNGPTPARSDLSFEDSDALFYRLINTVLQQQTVIDKQNARLQQQRGRINDLHATLALLNLEDPGTP